MIAPLRELAEPALDLSGQMPYAMLQSAFDPFFPKGWFYYWKSLYLNDLSAESKGGDDSTGDDQTHTERADGALASQGRRREPGGAPDATAFGRRDRPSLLSLDTNWTDQADTEQCIAWTRNAWSSMQCFGPGGLYLNFAGFGEEKEALVRSSYGDNYDRLVELKTMYDPGNLFRMNNNIKPMELAAAAD
ncbi:hypothetical protein BH23CHL4_BH23CHL4_09140 [soil metagenome]